MGEHDNTIVDTTLNGRWPLRLPRARAERAEWHTEAGWERARLDRMADMIQPGDLVCYLGAECGDMPALVASWGADVVLVEPNWKAHEMIRAIFEANDLTDRVAATFSGFAGDAPRRQAPGAPSAWGEPWSAAAHNGEDSPYDFRVLHQYPDVAVTTVDLIRERVDRKIDYISLDIEGAELRALTGAAAVLAEDRPVVFCSTHPDFLPQYGDTAEDLHAYMARAGYCCERLDEAHEIHELWTPCAEPA